MTTMEAVDTLDQVYEKYTEDDQAIWRVLYEQQMAILPELASSVYLEGLPKAGFLSYKIPHFKEDINPKVSALTGWTVGVVPGLVDHHTFFEMLAKRIFPSSTWLRTKDQLDYLEEPDMFHDTFGHIPLLTNPEFCSFLSDFSAISLQFLDHEPCVEVIRRLYWFTVEFGLIKEDGKLKIYGGGIISSPGESIYAIQSDIPARVPFSIDEIIETPVKIDEFQKKYFVIDSYEQLWAILPEFEQRLQEIKRA